jgi:hypothetical protein
MTLTTADGPAFIRLMKHYVIDYTNRNDQSQTAAIMEPDYLLRMGEHRVQGRDTAYHAATAKQMDQFPNLCMAPLAFTAMADARGAGSDFMPGMARSWSATGWSRIICRADIS